MIATNLPETRIPNAAILEAIAALDPEDYHPSLNCLMHQVHDRITDHGGPGTFDATRIANHFGVKTCDVWFVYYAVVGVTDYAHERIQSHSYLTYHEAVQLAQEVWGGREPALA